jgi:hypothetical protein
LPLPFPLPPAFGLSALEVVDVVVASVVLVVLEVLVVVLDDVVVDSCSVVVVVLDDVVVVEDGPSSSSAEAETTKPVTRAASPTARSRRR